MAKINKSCPGFLSFGYVTSEFCWGYIATESYCMLTKYSCLLSTGLRAQKSKQVDEYMLAIILLLHSNYKNKSNIHSSVKGQGKIIVAETETFTIYY